MAAAAVSARTKQSHKPSAPRLRKVLDATKTGASAEALERSLLKLIVGQDEAIEQIVNVYQMHVTGLSAPGRPIGNFLFLGPTGSGKTRTVEALAEVLQENPRAVVKIDCAEFQHSHEIAKLIGSPPGYLGHKETHPLLSPEIINQYANCKIALILFDEIEKASDSLWNLLLGILDKATLTLGDNRKVDFSKCMIFMTSNLGASEMSALVSPKIGFRQDFPKSDSNLEKKLENAGVRAARRKFTPEFMNRIDKCVVFKTLGEHELRRILDLELAQVQHRIISSPNAIGFVLDVSGHAKDFLLAKGIDAKYGARHLKRAIERLVMFPLSNLIASGQICDGEQILVDLDPDVNVLVFSTEQQNLSVETMTAMILEKAA